MTYTPSHNTFSYSYNPEAAEPKDTQFNDEQWANGKIACSWCDEIIPGGETYFDIPDPTHGRTQIFCESCARYKFGHEAPYYYY